MVKQSDIFANRDGRGRRITEPEYESDKKVARAELARLNDQLSRLYANLSELRAERSRAAGKAAALDEVQRLVVWDAAAAAEEAEATAEVAKALKENGAQVVDLARITTEEQTYWFRRFHTSLAIGNGGAFLALATHLLDPALTDQLATDAAWTLAAVALGVCLAGAIPFALHFSRKRTAWTLAAGSAGLFVIGLAVMTWGAFGLAATRSQPPLTHPASSAPQTAAPPPTAAPASTPALPAPPSPPGKSDPPPASGARG